jgi:hypothetical protein
MDLTADLAGIPVKYHIYFIYAGLAFKYLSEFYSAVRAGGGLKRILFSFWLGETIPKVIADDYKEELKTSMLPKKEEPPQNP